MLPSVRPGKQTVWLAATGKKKPLNEGLFLQIGQATEGKTPSCCQQAVAVRHPQKQQR